MPTAKSTYGISLKLFQSTKAPVFLGGTLGLIPILQIVKHANWIKPNALIVHGNPTLGSSCCTMAGKTIPPVALPAAAIPIARLLFLLKYVLSKLTAGQNRKPFPRPQHTPCARNSCQYLVEMDAMKSPKTPRNEPMRNTGRKWPASVRRPVRVPTKKRRKTWTEPTQEMSELVWPRAFT